MNVLEQDDPATWDALRSGDFFVAKSLSKWMEKSKFRVGDKVVKLCKERELLGRFLIILYKEADLSLCLS